MGLNRINGWKKSIDHTLIFAKKNFNFVFRYPYLKFDKCTVPNKKVLVGKTSVINKRMAYVY